jgi:hypothetical protein
VTDEILYNATHDVAPKDDSDKDVMKMLDGGDGPEHARHYPKELILGRTMFGQECGFALSDAMDEQSLRWHNKAHWYLAGITMFAIALYLFGQSLSMGRNEETWTLVFFGLIVVAVGIGLAAAEGAQRISSAEYRADACDRGNAKSGDAAVRAAVQYAWGVSHLQIYDYESSVKELEEAVALEESPVMLGNYGFDTYLYGLVKKDRTLVKKGLKSSEDAITHDHEGQFLYLPYNVAVAELALGDMRKGLEMYSKTVTRPGMKNDGDLVAAPLATWKRSITIAKG